MAVPQLSTGIAIAGFTATIINVTPPNESREALPTSHMLTTGYMTFIAAALADGGDLVLEVQYDTAVASPILDIITTIVITYPSGDTQTFNAITTGFSPSADLETVMTATVTLKVADDIATVAFP